MKRTCLLLGLFMTTLLSFGVPAKKGLSKTIALADGNTVTVTLHGDEYNKYWETADGRIFLIGDNDVAVEISREELKNRRNAAFARKKKINNIRQKRLNASRTSKRASFKGNKKGLVILVNFKNLAMKAGSTKEEFTDMFNKKGYSKNDHIGSVRDYFLEQSYGDLAIDFDVVGPVTVSQNYAYYGANKPNDEDSYPASMVIEACKLVDDQVNFADYDWDNDNEVDQVFVIYAGYGESSGASSNTIWPHEFQLSWAQRNGDGDGVQTFDGVKVDTYAASCELRGSTGATMNGIGTACHEFSHCLGYPDFYDTTYSGGWGMQCWDLMDSGSYNGPDYSGEIPAGYTAYERWVAGWLEPKEISIGDSCSLKPINDNREAYIIYNDANHDEYYLFENHKPERWYSYHADYEATKQGLLVTHIDYSSTEWENNTPNHDPKHQRMSVVLANGKKGQYHSNPGRYFLSSNDYDGHMFPYNALDSLTSNSKPSTATYNANNAGNKFLPVSIKDIKINSDGTISFNGVAPHIMSDSGDEPNINTTPGESTFLDESFIKIEKPVDTKSSGILFYESFNKNNFTGGNDGKWSVNVAGGTFEPDVTGWECEKAFGAYQCAKFGTGKFAGVVTSPAFTYDGEISLSFNAGAWDSEKDGTELTLYLNDKRVAVLVMKRGAWSTYAFKTKLSGESRLRFVPSKRFFLDEVAIAKEQNTTGINTLPYRINNNKVYSTSGQYLGDDISVLPAGIYIVNGQKVLKH